MAQIRGSREYLLTMRHEANNGIARLRVDIMSAMRELGTLEAEKLAIDNILDELDSAERATMLVQEPDVKPDGGLKQDGGLKVNHARPDDF
jgi:hypothetical protein